MEIPMTEPAGRAVDHPEELFRDGEGDLALDVSRLKAEIWKLKQLLREVCLDETTRELRLEREALGRHRFEN